MKKSVGTIFGWNRKSLVALGLMLSLAVFCLVSFRAGAQEQKVGADTKGRAVEQAPLSFSEAAGMELPPQQEVASRPINTDRLSPEAETYYATRPNFNAANPGLPVEDFEEGPFPNGGFSTCDAPISAATNSTCFTTGQILPGVSFSDNPGPDAGALIGMGTATAGSTSKNIFSNTFADSFDITFNPAVSSAGMDLVHYTGLAPSADSTVTITIYNASNVLIATTTATASNAGTFWGVQSTTPIGRINILSTTNGAEGVDNIAFGVPSSCTPTTSSFTNNTPVTISSSGTPLVTSTQVVAGAGTYLTDVNLTTFLTHSWNSDIDMTITSPAGTVVTLTSDNASSNDNVFNGTVWDDDANPLGQVPYASNDGVATDHTYVDNTLASPLVPEEAMGAFIGENPNGTWTVTISDDVGGDGGSLASWTLNLATLATAPTITVVPTVTNSTPVAISNVGTPTVTSTVVVAGAGTSIHDVDLTTFLTHTWNNDIDMTLTSPAGTVVTLTTDNSPNAAVNVFNGTVWDDDANPLGQVPYTSNNGVASDHPYVSTTLASPLVPEEAMAAFYGENPNGTWTITINDDASADGGSLNSWSLDIDTFTCISCAPPPGQISTLFAGGNGGAAGGGVYFNANVGANPITVTSLDVNLTLPGAFTNLQVWVRNGTHVGFENTAAGWTQVATGSGTGAGPNTPTLVTLSNPFVLNPGLTGIAFVSPSASGFDYTNGNGANQTYTNADLTLTLGTANNTAFAAGVFTPRVWNGTLRYNFGGSCTDLAITKTDGITNFTAPGQTTYTIVVTNNGPNPAVNALVTDNFPAGVTVDNWTCLPQNQAHCTLAGAGNINQLVYIPVGGILTYTATATVAANQGGQLINTATVTAPATVFDTNTANNSATDTDNFVVSISGNVKQYVPAGNTNLAGVTLTLAGSSAGTATSGADGNFTFTNLASGGTWTITPSMSGKVFDPTSRTVTAATANVAGVNFIAYDTAGIPRNIHVLNTHATPGNAVTVPIRMASQGTEKVMAASIDYPIGVLHTPVVGCGVSTPGCTVASNTATLGKVGFTITAAGAGVAAGLREIATVTFQTNVGFAPPNAALDFSTTPTPQSVRDVANNELQKTFTNGFVVFVDGMESDVAGRNTGNGDVLATDVTQVRRFVVGTDTVNLSFNEFQRTDAAPLATFGDGVLGPGDVIQAKRYSSRLDALRAAAGPAGPPPPPLGVVAPAPIEEVGDTSRVIRTETVKADPGQSVTVGVDLEAMGDEIAASFTLEYDATRLRNARVTLADDAPEGAVLTVNTDDIASGRIGILVDASQALTRDSAARRLINVTFDVAANSAGGEARIRFTDGLAMRGVSNDLGNTLDARYADGAVSISGPEAAGSDLTGRVTTPDGRGLKGAQVTVIDDNGQARTVTTSTFGYYRFEGLAPSETYTVGITSSRHRFAARAITRDNLSDVDFVTNE